MDEKNCGKCIYFLGCMLWKSDLHFDTVRDCDRWTSLRKNSIYEQGFHDGQMGKTNQYVIDSLRNLADRLEGSANRND